MAYTQRESTMKHTRGITATILGSGTCVPSLDRHPCSVLIKTPTARLLVDAGPGTMGQLLKLGIQIDDIDMVLLSHFHLDHCAELAPFLFATKYPKFDRKTPLTLVGGTGLSRLLDHLNQAYDNTLEFPENRVQILELDENGSLFLESVNMQLQYTTVNHKPESRAFRFTDNTGFSLVYSGDTDECPQLIQLSRNADILICESALPDENKVPGHLTPSLAGAIAARADVKKLVLTHFYPECDNVDIRSQCRKTFSGPLVLARDLLTL